MPLLKRLRRQVRHPSRGTHQFGLPLGKPRPLAVGWDWAEPIEQLGWAAVGVRASQAQPPALPNSPANVRNNDRIFVKLHGGMVQRVKGGKSEKRKRAAAGSP